MDEQEEENAVSTVRLYVPMALHLKALKRQLDRKMKGKKITVHDLYLELIEKGLQFLDYQEMSSRAFSDGWGLQWPAPEQQPAPVPEPAATLELGPERFFVYKGEKLQTAATVKNLHLQGFKPAEIGRLIGMNTKSVFSSITRLKERGEI